MRQAELAEHYPSVRAEVHPTDLAAPGAVAALWETLDAGCCLSPPALSESPLRPLRRECESSARHSGPPSATDR